MVVVGKRGMGRQLRGTEAAEGQPARGVRWRGRHLGEGQVQASRASSRRPGGKVLGEGDRGRDQAASLLHPTPLPLLSLLQQWG